jgi:hypothetical protein
VVEFLVLIFITNVCAFFGLIKYYKNYMKGYAKIAFPLFELTKKDANFRWVLVCQGVFETLKWHYWRLDFNKVFVLDVDWFT